MDLTLIDLSLRIIQVSAFIIFGLIGVFISILTLLKK
jgi:hypothetical protein